MHSRRFAPTSSHHKSHYSLNQRKHRFQMTEAEIAVLEAYVHSIPTWGNIHHVFDRMKEKGVKMSQIQDTLRNGQIIEVNRIAAGEIRGLLRQDFGEWSVCVVVSLESQSVITVWKNHVTDDHSTLNHRNYQWKVDLISLCQNHLTTNKKRFQNAS